MIFVPQIVYSKFFNFVAFRCNLFHSQPSMFLLTEINFVCAEMRLQFFMSWVLYVDRNPKILKLCFK